MHALWARSNKMTEKSKHHSLPSKNPAALLLIGTQCPHCPAVITALTGLVKAGELARLEIVNLEQSPQLAQQLGVRSVPWVRIGYFELEGVHSPAEYRQWLQRAQQPGGMRQYIEHMLGDGQVQKVISLIAQDHAIMAELFELMRDADAKINLRLGIGVIMETFAAEPWFQSYIPALEELCQHPDARVRADACHNLALTENPQVIATLEKLLHDPSAEVREVAQDGLDELT